MEQAIQSCPPAEDMDLLAEELKRLLARHETILAEEGVRNQLQRLEAWIESEHDVPSRIMSQTGRAWLAELRDRLKLAADEKLRLEGEGGNPASTEQAEKIEELLKTIRRMEKIIDEGCTVKPH